MDGEKRTLSNVRVKMTSQEGCPCFQSTYTMLIGEEKRELFVMEKGKQEGGGGRKGEGDE